MALTPGTRLGPYDVATKIRVGGMEEVYQATDTNLDCTVAIRVLPEHVATDPDLKQRFEREAKTKRMTPTMWKMTTATTRTKVMNRTGIVGERIT